MFLQRRSVSDFALRLGLFTNLKVNGLATIVVIDDQIDDKGDPTGTPGTTSDVAKVELKVVSNMGNITSL